MKKTIFLLLSLIVVCTNIKADDDKPIEFAQLPAASQQFIKKHFSDKAIALVKMESGLFEKSYEVIFTNGDKAEFDRQGEWKEVRCKYTEVPRSIIPNAIQQYVTQHYPGEKIIKIEKEKGSKKKTYEIKLTNKLELSFDAQFRLTDIDD